MAYKINPEVCINCGACEGECPVECIAEVDGHRFITSSDCIDCGACAEVCPVECISPES